MTPVDPTPETPVTPTPDNSEPSTPADSVNDYSLQAWSGQKVAKFTMLFSMVMFTRTPGGLGLKIAHGVPALKTPITHGVSSVQLPLRN